jgi:hypothetical protein
VSSGVPPSVSQRWPWTWKVWNSSPIAITSHWTVSPTRDVNTGVLPTNARPSMVWKPWNGAKTTRNSRSGRGSPRPRIESAPYIPPAIESSIDMEWSWYGQMPADSRPAVSLYVNDWPGMTLPPLLSCSGRKIPSEVGRYSTPWKCIEWGASRSVSRFLKWIRSLSPTRAWMSGPGICGVRTGLPQLRV